MSAGDDAERSDVEERRKVTGEDRESKRPARDLRLPGSVAEIMASPPGPKIGAFFDLDGTLVAGFTAVILTQER
jgi:putative phosphoserine phosphatase/1-acylglycerol-3-phosphate O-acyltransferase